MAQKHTAALNNGDTVSVVAIINPDGTMATPGGAPTGNTGVTPAATSSAFVTATAAASFAAFGPQACTSLLVNNSQSTVSILLQFGGAGPSFELAGGQMVLIPGISNANQVSVKRSDSSATGVTVYAMGVTK